MSGNCSYSIVSGKAKPLLLQAPITSARSPSGNYQLLEYTNEVFPVESHVQVAVYAAPSDDTPWKAILFCVPAVEMVYVPLSSLAIFVGTA